jgi:hypothetical protein
MLAFLASSGQTLGGITWGGQGDVANQFYVSDSTGVKATIAHTWTVNGFDYFEVRCKVHGTAGEVEVNVNGVQVYLATNLDTDASAGNIVFMRSVAPNNSTARYDDLYLATVNGSGVTDFLGTPHVYKLTPAAEGNSAAWTPSAGTDNALMVDETPEDGDTTYVEAGSAGLIDLYTLSDLPAGPNTVHGLTISTEARKTTADATTFDTVLRTDGTNFNSAAKTLTTSHAPFFDVHAINPDTSAAWTVAEVNALEVGVEAN